MKTLFRIVRTLLVLAIVLPLALPVLLYVGLSFPSIRQSIAQTASRELTGLLGWPVTIGRVDVGLFNRIVLDGVQVTDPNGTPVLTVGHLGAGFSVYESVINGKPVVTYAELMGLHIYLSRDSASAPLNIQPVIDRLTNKDQTKPPTAFSLAVNMVVIRQSGVTYTLLDHPAPEEGRFDPSHISITDIRADIEAPMIQDDQLRLNVKRMSALERSGLTLKLLQFNVSADTSSTHVTVLTVDLPGSHLAFDDFAIPSILGKRPFTEDTRIATMHSYVALSDLSPLLPEAIVTDLVADIDIDAEGRPDSVNVRRLDVGIKDSDTFVALRGKVTGADAGRDSICADFPRVNVNIDTPALIDIIAGVPATRQLAHKLQPLRALGTANLLASIKADARRLSIDGSVVTLKGDIDIDAVVSRQRPGAPIVLDGMVEVNAFDPSTLLPALAPLTEVSLTLRGDMTMAPGGRLEGVAEAIIPKAVWKGMTFNDISAEARFSPGQVDFQADSRTPHLDFALTGGHTLGVPHPTTEIFADLRAVDLSTFISKGRFKDCILIATVDASVTGTNADDIEGWAALHDVSLLQPDGTDANLGYLSAELSHTDSLRSLSVTSRSLDLSLRGDYTFSTLVRDMQLTASRIFPALVNEPSPLPPSGITARLDMEVRPDPVINSLMQLPVEVIDTLRLNASVDGNALGLKLNAPWLQNKDKFIEQTSLTLSADGATGRCALTGATTLPTKKGPMRLELLSGGVSDSLDTKVRWKIDNPRRFDGLIDIGAYFIRAEEAHRGVCADIGIRESQLVFNDTVWDVYPAHIGVRPGEITVNGVGGGRQGQSLAINGIASADSLSRVTIDLNHIDLDYVFETLAISDAVVFGGTATGPLYGEQLLSPTPVLYTPQLHVDALSYNHCVMGDADIRSSWDNSTKTISILADVTRRDGGSAIIDGYIRPTSSELMFDFTASHAPVGFLKPFMSAFASDISGTVSGKAKLYGTFKNIDLEGRVKAENLKLKLDITNTTYEVTDSVLLTPGNISFSDVTITDRYGKKGLLSGYVKHTYFHDPEFRFDITNVRDMLVYDVGPHDTDDPWYGRIFGRGNASIIGVPGRIDINVNMTTEAKSNFTFVLTDAIESVDYDFITFVDRDKARKDSLAALDPTPLIVRQKREQAGKKTEGPPSQYVMDFNIDINPRATINLIMDPVGGDKIVAHGTGHLGMAYDSQGELKMRGEYTLTDGVYNFTLQDIIVKDFIIREGSSIRFTGDPYSAQLNITAACPTTANLTDLDESFQSDPELNRTNVKVNAMMMVTGDMRKPEINYDLEFPTLTSDIYRKVKSIVSTDEMMAQQIIYLLALSRFYTPDYMSATHGNELVSVASSTLSSRLGSMLGALSDEWSIAPSIRSSKGDFTDVEVDLALSSNLLDNRLLLNGNFGYRDKSLNNNTFIGDFDIRYLLNRAGTLQLKAYNRYNDQNYYLKSALTTQGVGLVYKRDFDNIFSFLRPWRYKKKKAEKNTTDGTAAQ